MNKASKAKTALVDDEAESTLLRCFLGTCHIYQQCGTDGTEICGREEGEGQTDEKEDRDVYEQHCEWEEYRGGDY